MTGFTIPNVPDSGKSSTDQSEPDRGDFEIVGDRRRGVIFTSSTSLAVTASSGLTVNVASGEIFLQGYYYSITGSTTTLDAADASARFDLVVIRVTNPGPSGTAAITKIKGTASGTNPLFPTITDNDVVLAAIYVAGGATVISNNDIVDKRVFGMSSATRFGAGAPAGSLGNVGDLYVNTTALTEVGRSQLYVKTGASSWENIAEFANVSRNITVSTSTPSGGTSGDIWVKVV